MSTAPSPAPYYDGRIAAAPSPTPLRIVEMIVIGGHPLNHNNHDDNNYDEKSKVDDARGGIRPRRAGRLIRLILAVRGRDECVDRLAEALMEAPLPEIRCDDVTDDPARDYIGHGGLNSVAGGYENLPIARRDEHDNPVVDTALPYGPRFTQFEGVRGNIPSIQTRKRDDDDLGRRCLGVLREYG